MQLIPRCSLLALLCGAACGPDTAQESTWMIGTFSTHSVNARNIQGILHYEFHEDGSLVVSGLADWGKTQIEPVEHTWERLGDDLIEVQLPEPHDWVDRWSFSPASRCDQIQLYSLHGDDGVNYGGATLYRGKVCIDAGGGTCPSGTECDSSIAVWCDEPPPPCDDAEAP